MPVLRLFASAREAAGTGREELTGGTVEQLLANAVERHGDHFAAVLATCRVWVNGEEVDPATALREGDEVAVLPPVSGG
ncbi:MAG TPA: MoaD/ThiS family protein [Acidimicrobiales bacterium]|jgi:molybdopterin synthase sulfur carrier subunit|nr:MoaD/ThiS family protein [Acidimicrobiales bacterium]